MRAIVYDRYGPPDVLAIEEVEKPAPTETELLGRVHTATVNRLDCPTREANRSNGMLVSFLSLLVSGVRGPRRPVLGTEFAGEVETIGVAVTEFAVGDRVFGNTGLRFGTHAEFAAVPQTALVEHMPVSASYAEAAAVSDGALNALWCLHGRVRPGQKVLVYGASGSIGTAGVQLARHFGADVTAVCSTNNVELVRSLGADRVIDLHPGGFHHQRRDLRLHLRRGRQAVISTMQRLPQAKRSLPRDRRVPEPPPGCVDPFRWQQASGLPDPAALSEGGPAPPQGPHRRRAVPRR